MPIYTHCHVKPCIILETIVLYCKPLYYIPNHCIILETIVLYCKSLQHIANHCSTLQTIATHCKTRHGIACEHPLPIISSSSGRQATTELTADSQHYFHEHNCNANMHTLSCKTLYYNLQPITKHSIALHANIQCLSFLLPLVDKQ